jgi:hypothetical protein
MKAQTQEMPRIGRRSGTHVGRRPLTVAALLALTAACAMPGLSGAAAPTQGWETAIAYLNKQRTVNGIPPVGDYQPYATSWCPNEGDTKTTPGESGRETALGGSSWSRTTSPWDDAPLHQQGQYNPLYTQAGYTYVGFLACLGVGAPDVMPNAPKFYSFTSTSGPSAVPTSELVPSESPFSPEQVVGITHGLTGPVIILYALGFPGEAMAALPPTMTITSWSIMTAHGVLLPRVKLVDAEKIDSWDHKRYQEDITDGTAFLIPPVLRPATTYFIRVSWKMRGGEGFTQRFSFKTTHRPTTEHPDML